MSPVEGIAKNTFYRWRKAYGGMSVNEAQRLKELQKENARLKRLLAERLGHQQRHTDRSGNLLS